MENNYETKANIQREIAIGDIAFDMALHELHRNGRCAPLTLSESKILAYIVFKAGKPVPTAELLERVMETRQSRKTTVVEPHISRLRAKMRALGAKATIRAIRNQGYVITTC